MLLFFREYLSQNQNDFLEKVKALHGETLVSTLAEPLAELRTSIENKYQTWKVETNDQVDKVKAIVERHMNEYKSLLTPVMNEYREKHNQEMEQLKIKLLPVMEQVREKMIVNVEETQNALKPIMENVLAKINEGVEWARKSPVIEEYKEQLSLASTNVRSLRAEDVTALREKMKPLVGEFQTTLQKVFEAISETIVKN